MTGHAGALPRPGVLYFLLSFWPDGQRLGGLEETDPLVRDLLLHQRRPREIYDIFEGAEQIQQLVIARAISGLRIE